MNLYSDKKDCCGCTACVNMCPKGAISMKEDEQGFLYPQIDNELCIKCGLCKKICAFSDKVFKSSKLDKSDVYAVKCKSDDIRLKSSSGGMFTVLSDYVLDNGGVIYGADYDNNFWVFHGRATTKVQRDRFRVSKYVQSEMRDAFPLVEKDLREGKCVLFTGTPCQVAGLRSFLGRDYDNLYLQDIVCHGTPSPKVWKDYIGWLEKKYNSKVVKYSFRNKQKGWRGYNIYVKFADGRELVNKDDITTFVNVFGNDVCLRESCYNCKYANLNRVSDITIGDFWGIEKVMPDFEDAKGVSLVLVNTKKGQELFENIKGKVDFRVSNTEDCLQHNLKEPTAKPSCYDQFWNEYDQYGVEYVLKKYGGANVKSKVKVFASKVLKKLGLLDKVKKLMGK